MREQGIAEVGFEVQQGYARTMPLEKPSDCGTEMEMGHLISIEEMVLEGRGTANSPWSFACLVPGCCA